MTAVDSLALAKRARLRYVSDEEPGIRRRRRGRGFSFAYGNGRRVSQADRARISSLGIPPAWTEVWICPDADGHIQATGRDAAGRKQYCYHPAWDEVRDEAKFERLGPFGLALPQLRRTVEADLRRRRLPHIKVVALAVAVLDQTLIRVGNQRYCKANGSFGVTTLEADHVEVEGDHVRFSFTAKGGAVREVALRDARLASQVSRCQDLEGQRLFSYESERGIVAVTSDDVNAYLGEAMGEAFTAKDFRTWGGSAVATASLAVSGPPRDAEGEDLVLAAIDEAAEALGNTRAVCRESYVHPLVIDAYRNGELVAVWRRSRSGRLMRRPEKTLVRLLNGDDRVPGRA
ncbi:DNA topoisomerase IB [soil metagenome]